MIEHLTIQSDLAEGQNAALNLAAFRIIAQLPVKVQEVLNKYRHDGLVLCF